MKNKRKKYKDNRRKLRDCWLSFMTNKVLTVIMKMNEKKLEDNVTLLIGLVC